MQPLLPTPVSSVPPRQASRRGGSILILVVASIAMLAFLGGLFLVTTHTQRYRTPDVGSDRSATRQSDVNLVLESVQEEIARQIKADVFNPIGSTNEGAAFDAARGVEISDRAWLNPSIDNVRETTLLDGTVTNSPDGFGNLLGGEQDDTWLASTYPHRENGDPSNEWVWGRITSLTGGSFHVEDFDARLPIEDTFAVGYPNVDDTGDDRFVREEASGENVADYYEDSLIRGQDFNIPLFGLQADQERNPDVSPPAAPLLVDADGDGVPDSRFERAPLAVLGGIEYFMAVRVVDLASMLNLNTAGSSADSGGNQDPTDPPRARHPGDLDAGQFFGLNQPSTPDVGPLTDTPFPYLEEFLGSVASGPIPDQTGILGWRLGSSVAPGARPTAAERTAHYDAAEFYGESLVDGKLLPETLEAELRQRMGLYDENGASILRTMAPQTAVEPRTQYTTSTGAIRDHRNNPLPKGELDAIYGYNKLLAAASVIETPFPRTYLTTRSAANEWRTPLPGESGGGSVTNPAVSPRSDLNSEDVAADADLRPESTKGSNIATPDSFPYLDQPAEETALQTALLGSPVRDDSLFNTIVESTVAPAIPWDGTAAGVTDFETSVITGMAVPAAERPLLPRSAAVGTAAPAQPVFDEDTVDRFATQMVASLQDYRDHDNRLTVLSLPTVTGTPGPGEQVYGMEALPAITEVYAQRRYIADSSTPNATDSTQFDIVWEEQSDVGFAIEISNPFNRPIPLNNVHLYLVEDDGAGGGTEQYVGELSELADEPAGMEFTNHTPSIENLEAANATAGITIDDTNTGWDETRMLQPGETIILWRESEDDTGVTPTQPNDMKVSGVILDDANGDTVVNDLDASEVAASEVDFQVQPAQDATGTSAGPAGDWLDHGGSTGAFGPLRVELRAESASTITPANPLNHLHVLPFAYQSVPLVAFPDSYTELGVVTNYADPALAADQRFGYAQASMEGSSEGINMLLVPASVYTVEETPEEDSTVLRAPRPGTSNTATAPGFFDDPDELGRDKTPPTGYTEIPADENQWIMVDDPEHELASPGELATLLLLAPQESDTNREPLDAYTVADIFDASTTAATSTASQKLDDFRLNLAAITAAHQVAGVDPRLIDARTRTREPGEDGTGVNPAADFVPVVPAWHVPHFVHLLSSFTTHADLYTQAAGSDLPTLAGPLNLNTVSPSLLADALPVAQTEFRRSAAIAVAGLTQEYDVTADDGLTRTFNDEAAPSPGITTTWELANPVVASQVKADFLTSAPYAGDDFEVDLDPTTMFEVDFLPGEIYGSNEPDGVENDIEEAILPVSILDAVATTRSDVFVGYILLHGYETGKFDEGPKKVLRVVTLFDRSQMETVEDDVRVEVLRRLSESPNR